MIEEDDVFGPTDILLNVLLELMGPVVMILRTPFSNFERKRIAAVCMGALNELRWQFGARYQDLV